MAGSEARRGRACAARVILALGLVWGNTALASPPLRLVDALRMALSGNPDVKVQETVVEAARGQQLQAAGQFDVVLSGGVNYDKLISPSPVDGVDQQQTVSTGYRAGVVKQLRNGASVGTTLDAAAITNSALPGAQQPNKVVLGVSLNLPLLRGRGAREVRAAEDAATLTVQASELALHDTAAQTLYRTLSAYWTYSIRFAQEKATLDSEQRSRDLFASTQKLVEASERPPADLVLLKADLADRVAARQAAGLALSEARSTLGRLLGLDAAAIAALAAPADDLPAILDIGPPATAALLRMHAAALARRPDLLALTARRSAAERQAEAAHLQLRPVLDLEVGVSYAKVSESGRRFPWIGNVGQLQRGPSVGARLNYQFPLQNTSARGVVRERDAVLDQLTIQRQDLATAVASGIDLALQSLASNAAQLKVAQEALSLYEQAVRQEIIKQRNGISTLIDVINIETRFINARTNYLQTQLAYANAIAKLRFETGTLLPAGTPGTGGARFELDPAELAGLGPIAGELVPRNSLTR